MDIFIPELLIQLGLFSAFAGFGLFDESRNGALERFRFGGFLVTLGLMTLLGLAFTLISYALAIHVKSEDALAAVLNTVTFPLLLLSGIILPMSLAPTWLRRIADANPLAYAVDASRDLFNGRAGDADVAQATPMSCKRW